jgi:hypothetical protein
MTSSAAPTFVFVLGTGRCGSTLVHDVLARHPAVGSLLNVDDRLRTHVSGRWGQAIYRRLPVALTEKGRTRLAPSEGYEILERRVSPILSRPVRDLVADDASPWLAERLRGFFDQLARARRTPVVLHKFTGWPRARFLHAVLPSARFVHVVRDGRAVANSLLQMPWWRGYEGPEAWGWGPLPDVDEKEWEASGRSFPVLAALQWRLLMDAFDDARDAIPADLWHEARFEDFVDSPREGTRSLLEFVGLTWTDAFERNFRHHRFRTARKDAFLRDLGRRDLEDVEGILAERLERLGYARASGGGGVSA